MLSDFDFHIIDSNVARTHFIPIYLDSFPESERRPVDNLLRQVDSNDMFNFYGLYLSGEPVGFITTWEFDDFVYVEHLAIDAVHRGAKCGSTIIKLLQESTSKPIILEVEALNEIGISDEEQHIREARVRFYQHLGFKTSDVPYEQPAYSWTLPALPLMLMEYNGNLLPDRYEMVKRNLYHFVYEID